MAEISNSAVIGAFDIRPSAARLDTLARYDKALGSARHEEMHRRPASFFVWSLFLLTAPNASSEDSLKVKAPFPLTIWAADVGAESAGGSAATVDIRKDDGSDASILDAAEDVYTAIGTASRVAPEADSEDLAYDDIVYIRGTGTGSGDVVGCQAHLYCQRK